MTKSKPTAESAPNATRSGDLSERFQQAQQRTALKFTGAVNTIKGYASDIRHYEAWCDELGLVPVPVSKEAWYTYLSDCAQKDKWATLNRRMAAIRKLHKQQRAVFPAKDADLEELLETIRREKGTAQKEAPAFDLETFRTIIRQLDAGSMVELRAKLVLLLGFAGAFRREELVALNLEDFWFVEEGMMCRTNKSKTNQYGELEEKAFFWADDPTLCPVRTFQAWQAIRPSSGPLLVRYRKGKQVGELRMTQERLSAVSVASIVKHYLGDEYSAHSLRVSFVTISKLAGADDGEIMQQTKHKTVTMIRHYTRVQNVRQFNSGKKLGL